MTRLVASIAILMSISACSVSQNYVGMVTDCHDSPISNSKVTAWKNGWVPLTLPPQLGTTYTGDNGGFSFTTEKKASFFTYGGGQLTFSSHPDLSESNCDGDS